MPSPRKNKLLSFSAIETFDNCETRYFKERVEDRPQEENLYQVIGHVYHEVLAQAIMPNAEPDLVIIKKVFDSNIAISPLLKTYDNIRGLAAEIANNIARLRAGLWQTAKPAWTERMIEDHALGYRGIVDLLSLTTPATNSNYQASALSVEKKCVLDYKILTSDRRRSHRDAVMSPQLALYALMTASDHAAFVEIPRNLERPINTLVVEYTSRELENWRVWLVAYRAAILSRGRKAANYKRTSRKNPLCSVMWCPWFSECYPYKKEPV